MDIVSLKQKLAELQREQARDTVEGVHYTTFDVRAPAERAAQAKRAKRQQAIAFTPTRPATDLLTPAAATPGPVPKNPRMAQRARNAEEAARSADGAARRNPAMPFQCRDADASDDGDEDGNNHEVEDERAALAPTHNGMSAATGGELMSRELDFETSTTTATLERTFHASQQEALNAELRLRAEQALFDWDDLLKQGQSQLLTIVNRGPATAASHVGLLKTYEDNYQCVHPIDEDQIQAKLEDDLKLRTAAGELVRLTETLPPLDREAIVTTLGDLTAPFAGVGRGMPTARMQQRHAALAPVDAAARDEPLATAIMRQYEDLYLDVLGPARRTLEGTDDRVAQTRIEADDALAKRQQALLKARESVRPDSQQQSLLDGGDDTRGSSSTMTSPRRVSKPSAGGAPAALLAAVAQHQRREAGLLADLVAEYATRHSVLKDAEAQAHKHAADSQARSDLAAGLVKGWRSVSDDTLSRVVADKALLEGKADAIGARMLAEHRQYLAEQSEAHNSAMALQTEEQAAWAVVAQHVVQANALAAKRRDLIFARMKAREQEALRQRRAALELRLVRTRLVATRDAERVLRLHMDVADQLAACNATLASHQVERDVVGEHATLWRGETRRAAAAYGEALLVTDDLLARTANRLELALKEQREAELDLELAVEVLDPDAPVYKKQLAALTDRVAELQRASTDLSALSATIADDGLPIVETLASRGWGTASGNRDAMMTIRRKLSAREVVGSAAVAVVAPSDTTGAAEDAHATSGRSAAGASSDDEGDGSDNDDPKFVAKRVGVRRQLAVTDSALQHKAVEHDAAEALLTAIRSLRAQASAARKQHEAAVAQRVESLNPPQAEPAASRDGSSSNGAGQP